MDAPRPRALLSLGLAVLVLLGAATVWDWRARIEASRRTTRGYAHGLSLSTHRALSNVSRRGSVPAAAAREVIGRIMELTPARYVGLALDGAPVVESGPAPCPLAPRPPGGEREVGSLVVIWHALPPPVPESEAARGPPPPPHALTPQGLAAPGGRGPGGPPGARGGPTGTLVVAFDAGPPPRTPAERLELGARFGLALLAAASLWLSYVLGRRGQRQAVALTAERARSQSLAELGVTAAGLAHETKNPLGIIIGLAEQILRDPAAPPEHRRRAEQIVDAGDRAASRLGEFMDYARLREARADALDLRRLVRGALELVTPDLEAAQVTALEEVDPVVVRGDEEMLLQLLLNLLLNAVQASSAGARVVVRARPSGPAVRLEVVDTGRGLEPDLLARAFEPYVTGRADGHGLGLAIVRRLAQLQGWTVTLESAPGQGTRVIVDGLMVVSP